MSNISLARQSYKVIVVFGCEVQKEMKLKSGYDANERAGLAGETLGRTT
jgi:G:T-mismatch repair DNA endonuclease (very short patch repair protein)